MPDSWIDREELDELVGSFSTSRKGRKRRVPLSSRREERSEISKETLSVEEPEPESDAGGNGSDTLEILQAEATGSGTPVDLNPVLLCENDSLETHCAEDLPNDLPVGPQESPDTVAESRGDLPEIILAKESDETGFREVPRFFDDKAESLPPRPLSLSERDADRAHISLAEARSRVEQGRLLRAHGLREHPVAAPEEVEEVEEVEMEDDLAPSFEEGLGIQITLKEEDEPEAEARFSTEGTLYERIGRFAEVAKERLEAIGVAVSDGDGFLLHAGSEGGADGGLETALLLEVSGRANRLLGIGRSRATQVSTGGGIWRCLIRGTGGAEDLFAGFCLRRPLEQDEIDFWTKSLAEVMSPTPLAG